MEFPRYSKKHDRTSETHINIQIRKTEMLSLFKSLKILNS